MTRFINRLALLAKVETTYATDAVPTGAANAMQASNVEVTPLAGSEVSRELLLPYWGHQGAILVENHATIAFDVELAGSGTAGTAPAWGSVLRGCGFDEVVSAGVKTEYTLDPSPAGLDAVSLYYNLDGVNHILLGARGTMTLALTPSQIPRMRFTMTGLLGTIADVALPATTLTGFKVPVPVNKANTTLSLHGLSAVAESVSFDIGNQVATRFLIGDESIRITGRQTTGQTVVEAKSLAVKNWFQIAQAHTTGALAVQHGVTAGNIVKFDAPAVQIGRPTQGQSQNLANYSLPLMFKPSTGNDELKITVQ